MHSDKRKPRYWNRTVLNHNHEEAPEIFLKSFAIPNRFRYIPSSCQSVQQLTLHNRETKRRLHGQRAAGLGSVNAGSSSMSRVAATKHPRARGSCATQRESDRQRTSRLKNIDDRWLSLAADICIRQVPSRRCAMSLSLLPTASSRPSPCPRASELTSRGRAPSDVCSAARAPRVRLRGCTTRARWPFFYPFRLLELLLERSFAAALSSTLFATFLCNLRAARLSHLRAILAKSLPFAIVNVREKKEVSRSRK